MRICVVEGSRFEDVAHAAYASSLQPGSRTATKDSGTFSELAAVG